ncbi:hypothetical protein ACJJTC_001839 [Scirpophaga incertulas]
MLRKCEIHSEATAVVDNFLTELLKKTWLLINPKKRWRKSDLSSWARNVAKKRRADGLPYVTKSKHTIGVVQKRNTAKKCFLTKKNEARQVCQKFFSKTVITDAIKKLNDMNCFDACDARGGHQPVNKTKPDIIQSIRSHIASFPCMEAHYSRKDSQRRYLDKNFNVRKMYLLYEEECLKNELVSASEITYRRIFSYFVTATAEKKKELEDAYLAHQERKKTCNKEKDKIRANSENSLSSVTFYLQAVLQIPTCDVGLLYYSRKLCVYNLTVYEAGLPMMIWHDAYCFPWSEEFKYDEFFDLKHLAPAIIQNRTKDQNGEPVQWLKIKRIRYIKGEERKIYFNYDMSENFNAIEVGEKLSTSKIHHEYSTRKKMRGTVNETPADQQFPDQLNRVYLEPIKITEAKKRDLINLCRKGIIPEELVATVATGGHGWFENMETEKRSDDFPSQLLVNQKVKKLIKHIYEPEENFINISYN